MNQFSEIVARIRGIDVERMLGLRPPWPPVVLKLERNELALIRVKNRRRGARLLEAYATRTVGEGVVPASIFQAVPPSGQELPAKLRELFDASGTRPGRVSLLLPDNLAKISLLKLPERPASRKQLSELVRAQMRRAVPFRLDDASFTYQLLSGESREVGVLVVLIRKALVERFEQALASFGARAGLVDICTPNLLNLCRERMNEASRAGADVALLNRAANYFSLAIVREGKLIFFRCKSFATRDGSPSVVNGMLSRELSSSLSYYREKLAGRGVQTVFVRSVVEPTAELAARLQDLGCGQVEAIDAVRALELGNGLHLEAADRQSIAAAIGAATARSG